MVMEEEQSHMELASESVPVPQVIITNELMEDDVNNAEISTPKKKPRLRKKALHAAIRKQMEFYFGDSNLSKDRFLGNLIKQDPYVELSVFLRFNKIRTLTTDLKQIVKALQKSEMLSVSEDESRVCRVTPISQKDNIDECTIYVQRLPLNADHEWLSTVFSQYGQVAYVSIPRYKSNKKIKGFAFVEFEEVSSAVKCIEGFREKSCVLPSQTSPDSLLSITTFHEEEMMEKKQRKERYEETVKEREARALDEVKTEGEEKGETKIGKKRRHEESDESRLDSEADSVSTSEKKQKKSKQKEELDVEMKEEEDTEKSKKRKTSEVLKEEKGEAMNEENADSDKEKKSKKRKQKSLSGTKNSEDPEPVAEKENCLENDEVFTEDEVLGEQNQKRKRKRKRTNRGEKVDTADIGMQIMAKRDWKTLRNKYLELQRSKMKSLKAHLKRARWNQWNNYEKFRESDKSKAPKEEVNENSDDKKDEKSKERFVFTPGVIVRVELDEPCTDPKSFKTELKRNTSIKYIDVSEGANEAFLRCDTNEAAKALVLQSNEDRTMSILQDNEESQYWNKISKDREDKLGKKVRVKQRGRDKLLKKAEKELGKHIKFDEV